MMPVADEFIQQRQVGVVEEDVVVEHVSTVER